MNLNCYGRKFTFGFFFEEYKKKNSGVSMEYRTTCCAARRVIGKCLQTFKSISMTETKRTENCSSKQCEGKERKIILAYNFSGM